MRTLLVWSVSAFIIGGSLYSKYKETYHPEIAEEAERVKQAGKRPKMTPSAEDLTRLAKEREAKEDEMRRKFEQEINEKYEVVQVDEDELDRLTQTDDL